MAVAKQTAEKPAKKPGKKASTAKPPASRSAKPKAPSKPFTAANSEQAASDSIDEQLAKYRSMRNFATTAEPSGGHGKAPKVEALPFVIQKHAATRLHYDFRLGWHGVLKSWAVAKGPSYVVADKRLAVQVEDHPMEYGGFEGTIPKGQYGGGTVMLWDEGTWEPVGDGEDGFRTGRLKFILHGKKLKGKWTLIRMGGKAAQEAKPNWLLIKEHDDLERPATSRPVTEDEPDSVITGRDLTQIAAAADHVWDSRSGLAADKRKAAASASAGSSSKKKVAVRRDLSSFPEEAMPGFLPPQLASHTSLPPTGDSWVHELKLDGYRMQAHIANGRVTVFSRNGLDWTARVKSVADALRHLPVHSAILDGEIVLLDEKGLTSFAGLQSAFDDKTPHELTYFCFDLLHIDGHTPRGARLDERKALLQSILAEVPDEWSAFLRYSEHLQTDGSRMFAEACRLGAEGIISKKLDAKYASGRTSTWTKSKCILQQEFVIGGYTPPSNKSDGLGALLLGYYDGDLLQYAGRAGTGFTQKSQRTLRASLEKLHRKENPFAHVPGLAKKDAIWVKPEMVAEVQFRTWTTDGMLRQASFQGLREDKAARDVNREPSASWSGKVDAPDKKTRKHPGTDRKNSVNISAASARPHASIRLTHPDKIIDAESGLTKQTLADYYDAIADQMLPHIAHRPLSIVRCPDGSTGNCFFQKHMKVGLPKNTGSVDVRDKKTGKIEPYITISTKEALVGMAQMNVLELHPWGSSNAALEQPDRLIFDLDPDEHLPWKVLAACADEVHNRLSKLGLRSFLKGTGGKGLHIVAPIEPTPDHDWSVLKSFAHDLVENLAAAAPQLYLTKMTKAARAGKIYLDYLRNERGATAVAPFSPRRRSGVPVSVPFSWSVLKENAMPRFRVADFAEWIGALKNDPWRTLASTRQALTPEALQAVIQK